MKKCIKCKELLSESLFSTKNGGKYLSSYCKNCHASYSIERNRTLEGLIVKIYGAQKATSKIRCHDLPTYTTSELREWMLIQPIYHELHSKWVESGYDKMKVPSVDRLDDYKGYTLSNIQLMTWEENKRKGHDDRKNGINNKKNKSVSQYSLDETFIQEFHSMNEAARQTGVNQGNISACINGKLKHAGGFIWKTKTINNYNQ